MGNTQLKTRLIHCKLPTNTFILSDNKKDCNRGGEKKTSASGLILTQYLLANYLGIVYNENI